MNTLGPDIIQAAYPFAWLLFLLDFALKGALLISIVLILTKLLAKFLSSATRHSLLFFSLCAVVLLPLASNMIPEWRVVSFPEIVGDKPSVSLDLSAQRPPSSDDQKRLEQFKQIMRNEALEGLVEPEETDAESARMASEKPAEARPAQCQELTGQTVSETPGIGFFDPLEPFTKEVTTSEKNHEKSLLGNPHWSFWLFAAWFAGAGLVLARLLIGSIGSYWIIVAADKEPGSEWLELLKQTAGEIGVGRQVHLMFSARLDLPKSGGILWPVIILPNKARDWDPERRKLVLSHELAHIKRWDVLTLMVGRFACALNWFNPIMWYAHLKMRNEMERACDDLVLAGGTKPSEYALHLTQIARSLQSSRPSWAAAAMAHRSSLKDRLLSILDPAAKRAPARLVRSVIVAILVLMILIPLAAFHPWSPPDNPRLGSILDKNTENLEEQVGNLVLEDLIATLSAGDENTRQLSALLLGRAADERAAEPLITALGDESPKVRQYASWALGRIGCSCATCALEEALYDPDNGVRRQALWALGQIGQGENEQVFANALYNDDASIRMQAAHALRQSENEETVARLIRTLNDRDVDVRLQAVRALGEIGNRQALLGLTNALRDRSPLVRKAAIRVLQNIDDPQVVGALAISQYDSDPDVRREALRAMGETGDPEAAGLLNTSLIIDGSVENRLEAVRALDRIDDPKAMSSYVTAIKDDDLRVRRAGYRGLCRFRTKEAVPHLTAALVESYYLTPVGDDIRLEVIRALKEIGDPRAAEALRYVIYYTKNSQVRRVANEALRAVVH